MKYKLFAFLFYVSISISIAQNTFFEGEIKYKVTIDTKSKDIDPKLLIEYDNRIWQYYFKNGNFKWILPSKFWSSYLYIQKENRIFYIPKQTDIAIWQNVRSVSDSMLEIKILKGEINILNISCKQIVFKSKYLSNNKIRERTYFYPKKIKINAKLFVNYRNNNLDEIYKRTNALPLKIIDDFGDFKITYQAIEINPKYLEPNIFTIDKKFKLEEIQK